MIKAMERTQIRVLVTGSTTWTDFWAVDSALSELAERAAEEGVSLQVLTGMADGADELARRWARQHGVSFHAETLEQGRYPGPMHRYNEQLLDLDPDVVLAFKENFHAEWDLDTCVGGTEHMCRIAARVGVPVILNGQQMSKERAEEKVKESK